LNVEHAAALFGSSEHEGQKQLTLQATASWFCISAPDSHLSALLPNAPLIFLLAKGLVQLL
jgi:hypothetical protein